MTTYNSSTDLSLGQVPDIEDPILYRELLDIHNAIESLLSSSDTTSGGQQDFIDKFRNFSNPAVTTNYNVLVTDGTVRVDATAGDITVTLPAVLLINGYRYDVKRIDLVTANKVTLLGAGAELVDGRAGGINISTKSSYTVKAHTTGWDII